MSNIKDNTSPVGDELKLDNGFMFFVGEKMFEDTKKLFEIHKEDV